MKKLLSTMLLSIIFVFVFTACEYLPEIPGALPGEKEGVITVEDGYLVVNGVKTEHKVHTDPIISVIDGYVAVNGVKTEYKVDSDDVIEVVDGHLVVNGVKTEYKVDAPDVIEIIDGYVVVNGVKTDIFVSACNHSWTTVTTDPTCTAGGYDTKTCSLCGKSVVENETAKLDHTYSTTYSFDDNNHWFKCTGCDAKKDTAVHTPDNDGVCTVCQALISATPGVIYDISADGTYAEVIGYEGTATKVKIASEYKGLPVKTIADNAFARYKGISELIIPEGVISIGSNGLLGCSNCTITLPSTLTSIGDYAFMGCNNVSININDLASWCQRTFYVDTEYDLYLNGVLVSDLVIPAEVTEICNYAFNICKSLKSVVIHDGVTSMGISAFGNCINLESVQLSSNIKVIQMESFRRTNIKSIIIPNGVEEICSDAFYGCENLVTVEIPDSVRTIANSSFTLCSNIKYSEYDNCGYLGNSSNPYYALIKTVGYNYSSYEVHPETKIVADHVFASCSRLGSVILYNKINDIGWYAFGGNPVDIYYTGTEEEWNAVNKNALMNTMITVHYNYTVQ